MSKRITKADRRPHQISVKQLVDSYINGAQLFVEMQNFCTLHGVAFSEINVSIDTDYHWGEEESKIQLQAFRMETPKEVSDRLEVLQFGITRDAAAKKEAEAKERQLYEQLKAKFG